MPLKSMLLKPLFFYKIIARIFIVLLSAVMVLLPAAGCKAEETHYFTVKVPVYYKDLPEISSLHLEIAFDDRLATPESPREAGGVGGIFTYGMQSASSVIIGIADISLKGSGTLAYISFKVNGDVELPLDLVLSNVSAFDAEGTKIDMQWTDGSINPVDKTFISPEIYPLQ